MRNVVVTLALAISLASNASAQTVTLRPELAGVSFLVGSWSSDDGKVADTGETAHGTSSITPEVTGSVLLRRDHTDLFAADGKPSGHFDQLMIVYPEAGTLHADYSDGTHIIHYVAAAVVAGHSVVFTSASKPGAPTYKLTYADPEPGKLAVRFEIAPPGQTEFHLIASGTLHRTR